VVSNKDSRCEWTAKAIVRQISEMNQKRREPLLFLHLFFVVEDGGWRLRTRIWPQRSHGSGHSYGRLSTFERTWQSADHGWRLPQRSPVLGCQLSPPCPLLAPDSFHTVFALTNNMDLSTLNPAEQAHMAKVIEKKQVCPLSPYCQCEGLWLMSIFPDARLSPHVLQPGRPMLHSLL
jgi:hypothetical protein